jgi:hypothetical protein
LRYGSRQSGTTHSELPSEYEYWIKYEVQHIEEKGTYKRRRSITKACIEGEQWFSRLIG